MIVPMSKVYVVSAAADRDRLLDTLGGLGVLHIAPVDAGRAVAEDKTLAAIDQSGRALQILENVTPSQSRPRISPEQATDEALAIQRQSAELHSRLNALHLQYEHLAVWGDARLEQHEQLRAAGLTVRFVALPPAKLHELRGECVHVLSHLSVKQLLVAVADHAGQAVELPEGAHEIPLPKTDRPAVRREAARIEQQLKDSSARLAELAMTRDAIAARRRGLLGRAEYTVASRSALADKDLFALQGWMPTDQAPDLGDRLAGLGINAAVTTISARPEDSPPTLLRAPRWAKPIEALLKAFGTVPGYREHDVSPAFMIALPIFAAMLISDACYSLLFLLVPAIFYRRVTAKIGKDITHLVMIFGVTGLVWGVITGSYFGVSPEEMIEGGGVWAIVGKALSYPKLFPVDISDRSQEILKRLCFILAALHLSSAHLWRAVVRFPNIRFLSSVGWAAALWGVFGLVNMLVLNDQFVGTAYPILLYGGLALAVGFATPRKYVIDGVALGALSSVFPAIATLSDTISYVRLMAIGLAGSVLAARFNAMAVGTGSPVFAVPILLVGHSLNIALCMIALVAHGVRLNILEFSNNLGMEWTGYPYKPFAPNTEET